MYSLKPTKINSHLLVEIINFISFRNLKMLCSIYTLTNDPIKVMKIFTWINIKQIFILTSSLAIIMKVLILG